jgi:mannose-6-phosphate isomerase-like protein (cupin superfamily)
VKGEIQVSEDEKNLDSVIDAALAALAEGGTEDFPLTDGRVVKVLASPSFGTSTHMAAGISVLPPDYATPKHDHEAEEIALVMRGSGSIVVAESEIPVQQGSIVVAPPNAPHITKSDANGPLVVYWTYGPAGSESRWLKGVSK